MGLFILEQVVLDTAFSANARNKYAAELLQQLRGHKESNKIRLKLGLITLIHYPILRQDLDLLVDQFFFKKLRLDLNKCPFMAKLAGPSFSHGYIIGQYENLKNDLNGLMGTGRHGIVDRAIRRAEQYDDDDFSAFLTYGITTFNFLFFQIIQTASRFLRKLSVS